MKPCLLPPVCRGIGMISAWLLAQAGAEPLTTVIRPSVAYTVKNLSGGVYQDKQPRLYSNGYMGTADAAIESEARMEFQIPPGVVLGMHSMEFRAAQNGFLPTDTGYTYLWYYTGNVGETAKDIPLARSTFTAEAVHDGTLFSRNLSNASTQLTEKFGLAISTRLATKKEVTFADAQLVITYDPPPADNGAAVSLLLTGPGKPFEGQTDPAVVGFDADPDRDGMANFFELWNGTAPDKADVAPTPFFSSTGGIPYVRVQINKYVDDRMLVGAQASNDLITWRDVSSTRTTITTADGQTQAKFTDVIPLASGRSCYFRFVSEPAWKKFP
ncbi:hypothetical protein [Luteolibacter soli]|uniref:Uncharacterized protein n=1 Tax=Luteolibacter soli TaxID=3135280 RepID=A0ABU9B032_9BACT